MNIIVFSFSGDCDHGVMGADTALYIHGFYNMFRPPYKQRTCEILPG